MDIQYLEEFLNFYQSWIGPPIEIVKSKYVERGKVYRISYSLTGSLFDLQHNAITYIVHPDDMDEL